MIFESKMIWSAKDLTYAYNSGTISLESARQRGLIWKPEQKSLLIHSLAEGYPIPSLYLIKEEGQLCIIDGKQRTEAIAAFINGDYCISKETPLFELESGDALNACGFYFNDMPEELRDAIKGRILEIIHVDNITDDQLDELFYRLNGGSAMSIVVTTCARTKSIEQINLTADHELFQVALSAKNLEKYAHKDLVIKSWVILNAASPSFKAKDICKLMNEVDITDEQVLVLWNCFSRLLDVYKYIDEHGDNEIKAMTLKNISKPSHFVMLVPYINRSLEDNIDVAKFATWIMDFYPGSKIASIDERYNLAARSNTKDNIRTRLEILNTYYENAFPQSMSA